ncbi:MULTISPECIES: putative quinol monooxygenase [Amycolatopsis]|uniref:Quinol monooxygenase YgiN n=2 Tax=Amycolatopsis TaxID=1813 RepID=A0A1I3JP56_9PSEU|nr:putative quinol monooxygenase [Amycolatopsis sacchari]SFI62033.1 Quinol monooxygenase YgiN [Amycolatopsis sacchari]
MTSENPVVVVATAEASPGKEDEVEQAFRKAVRAVHTEPGCLLYALHRDPRSPSTFVMVEKWASAEALATHGKAPALAELGGVLKGLLARPLEVRTLTPLPEGDERLGQV